MEQRDRLCVVLMNICSAMKMGYIKYNTQNLISILRNVKSDILTLTMDLCVPVSSDACCPSFTGVVLSDDNELTFPEAGLWLLSCELVGSVKASWVELESESITTSLS